MDWIFGSNSLTENKAVVEKELAEIRRLLAKAEGLICLKSNDERFCEQAKFSRNLVHDTPDPNNVKRGVGILTNLLKQMKERKLSGFERLNRELLQFQRRSHLMSEFGPLLVFDDVTNADLTEVAANILISLHNDWRIGPHFMPIHKSDKLSGPDLERAFSKWYDFAYSHAVVCVRRLVGLKTNSFAGPRTKDIDAFDKLRAACELALVKRDVWAPALIRCLIVAAHELRLGASTGSHGPARLRAKLIAGRLIGRLSAYDLDGAAELSDLTIESRSFSRSQILYEQEKNPKNLTALVKRWSRKNEHPMRLDVIAQGLIFAKQFSEAKKVLAAGKHILLTGKDRSYSSYRGEYYERTYTGLLADIYLARLARTLSQIDTEEALKWCEEISAPVIKLACWLYTLQNRDTSEGRQVAKETERLNKFASEHNLLAENLCLPAYELEHLATIRVYPDFPPERWCDLTDNTFVFYGDMIERISGKRERI